MQYPSVQLSKPPWGASGSSLVQSSAYCCYFCITHLMCGHTDTRTHQPPAAPSGSALLLHLPSHRTTQLLSRFSFLPSPPQQPLIYERAHYYSASCHKFDLNGGLPLRLVPCGVSQKEDFASSGKEVGTDTVLRNLESYSRLV